MEAPPKIRKIPVEWKYFCECNHEVHPWGFNYCAHCGRKLDWSAQYIEVKLDDKGSDIYGGDFFYK